MIHLQSSSPKINPEIPSVLKTHILREISSVIPNAIVVFVQIGKDYKAFVFQHEAPELKSAGYIGILSTQSRNLGENYVTGTDGQPIISNGYLYYFGSVDVDSISTVWKRSGLQKRFSNLTASLPLTLKLKTLKQGN